MADRSPRIVLAPDSFKESLTAREAVAAMARGVREAAPDAEVVELPMSDGGEGFIVCVASGLGARVREVEVSDALGRPTAARIAVAGRLVALDVASAVGLEAVAPDARDVMAASSRGVGELIRAALDALEPALTCGDADVGSAQIGDAQPCGDEGASAPRLVIGLGGSATNDGGAGMLAALGVRLLDDDGAELDGSPASLRMLATVDASGLDPRLAHVQVEAASDVSAPLCGEAGASAVFGPQKGASDGQVRELDGLLEKLARCAADAGACAPDTARRPGAGAAGGIGWALLALCGAAMRPGVEVVAEAVGLEAACRGADLVLTGEGSVDAQTLAGKVPAGVAAVAARAGVPCVVLAGRVGEGADALLDAGATRIVGITPDGTPTDEALARAAENLRAMTRAVVADLLRD